MEMGCEGVNCINPYTAMFDLSWISVHYHVLCNSTIVHLPVKV
jgi:hypothetical protein